MPDNAATRYGVWAAAILVALSSGISVFAFSGMAATISRLEGAVNTLGATITAQLQVVTREIKDGQQRMDSHDVRIRALEGVIQSHSRAIEAMKAGEARKP